MPEITIYPSTDALPPEFECQIRAYIRFLWYDHYYYDLDEPLALAKSHPHYVVLAERHALISAASIIWVYTELDSKQFKIYGLGNVFTYPAFRKQSYGQQVVEAATHFIKSDNQADIAILFTDSTMEAFYAKSGWGQVSHFSTFIGDKHNPEPKTDFTMMQFLSERSQAYQNTDKKYRLFLPDYSW